MWFYGCFSDGYSVNSTEVCEETHDNSDVIVLFKTEHIYLFKRAYRETKKEQYRTVSFYWNINFTPLSKLPRSFQSLAGQTL